MENKPVGSWLTGYGDAMMDQNDNFYAWLPILAPIIGGLIGAALFKYLILDYLPNEDEPLRNTPRLASPGPTSDPADPPPDRLSTRPTRGAHPHG